MSEGLRNETMIREGYRNYDSPVAMPNLESNPAELTLEDYFRKLDRDCTGIEKSTSSLDRQVGGDHYKKAVQPWEIALEWGLDPWAHNVVKYILRYPYKNGKQDLEKIQHYIEYLLENYDRVTKTYYFKE